MGITFDCPVHKTHRLGVMFANPIDGLPPDSSATHLWQRSGDTFETMTLEPSVDASKVGCWHGKVTNGEIK
jgi:hypothetical protein